MTEAVHSKVTTGLDVVESAILDQGTASFHAAADLTPIDFPNGTGSGQTAVAFTDTRTIAASSSENLDLAGALTDALGATVTFTVVKAIEIRAAAANTNNVVVGGAGTDAFVGWFGDKSDKIVIPPGGRFLAVHPGAGWTVTGGTGDILLVANSGSGTGVTYDVRIVG